MYEIEKNIPLPTKTKGGHDKATSLRDFLDNLEVGDSFILPKKEYNTFGNAKKFIRGKPKSFTSRKIDENNYRVFRIK